MTDIDLDRMSKELSPYAYGLFGKDLRVLVAPELDAVMAARKADLQLRCQLQEQYEAFAEDLRTRDVIEEMPLSMQLPPDEWRWVMRLEARIYRLDRRLMLDEENLLLVEPPDELGRRCLLLDDGADA